LSLLLSALYIFRCLQSSRGTLLRVLPRRSRSSPFSRSSFLDFSPPSFVFSRAKEEDPKLFCRFSFERPGPIGWAFYHIGPSLRLKRAQGSALAAFPSFLFDVFFFLFSRSHFRAVYPVVLDPPPPFSFDFFFIFSLTKAVFHFPSPSSPLVAFAPPSSQTFLNVEFDPRKLRFLLPPSFPRSTSPGMFFPMSVFLCSFFFPHPFRPPPRRQMGGFGHFQTVFFSPRSSSPFSLPCDFCFFRVTCGKRLSFSNPPPYGFKTPLFFFRVCN